MARALRRDSSLRPPTMPAGDLQLQPPPEIEPHEGIGNALAMALPMLGSVGSIIFVASAQGSGATGKLSAGMFLIATLGFVGVSIDRQRKQRNTKVAGSRREYLQYLSTVRKTIRSAAGDQRASLLWNNPDPDSLPFVAEETTRLWERTPDHEDFLQVRYGVTSQALALNLIAPESAPLEQLDPVGASALHRLLVVHRVQPDLPASIDLRAFSRIEITGEEEQARAVARAMMCSAAAFHSPELLRVAVLTDPERAEAWDWAKWLPHLASTTEADAVGARRMVVDNIEELGALLPQDVNDRPRFGGDQQAAAPHVLVVLDGTTLPPANTVIPEEGVNGVTIIDLPHTWTELVDETRLRLDLTAVEVDDDDQPRTVVGGTPDAELAPVTALRLRSEPVAGKADLMSEPVAEAFARRLAPLYVAEGPAREDSLAGVPNLTTLLDLPDIREVSLDTTWARRPARDLLRVPIGVGESGRPVILDIKEAAQQGMGPHGLVIGATGSGKSEFLRTLVLGLALTHSPEALNMVLVDFKGGATFAGISDMPHVSAVITNLENELTLVDRMQDALSGEMVRRQEMLRDAGNYSSVRDYEKARLDGADLTPLPSLFIVVDEFTEMLTAKPEFIDLFNAIGRLGRSLGLHLLLASQRLEEGRLRGLGSHLSYRIGLRTFSSAESREVLGVPDAYELPSVPGLGFLKPDQSTLLKFKAAYVSGPPADVETATTSTDQRAPGRILPFSLGAVLSDTGLGRHAADEARAASKPPPPAAVTAQSVLDLGADLMTGRGPEAHQVWLPPLDDPDTLDALLPDLTTDEEHGLHSPSYRARGSLVFPMGTVDKPLDQRRDTLEWDLTGASGNVAVVGGPRSGKSTVLRTMVTSLALTSTPREVQFYVLDFGGGTFTAMTDLPHISGVATRGEPDVVRRVVAEVGGIVDKREKFFRANAIDSVETYRERRRRGELDDGYGDVFIVVDGWSTLRSDFDELELELQTLAGRGLTFGVHLVTAAARWADFRAAIRDIFGTSVELRLGDPADSEIDRKIAALVPNRRPGRGLLPSKLHFLASLPRIDGDHNAETLSAGVEDLIDRAAGAWHGPTSPKLRLLPERIDLPDVVAASEQIWGEQAAKRIFLAINERELAPVALDLDAEPHLLAFGDSKSGKTAFLRAYIKEVMRTRTKDEAQFVLVDYRRSLLGEVPEDYLLHYLTSAPQAQPEIDDLAAYLGQRLPGPDITPEQLRSRSWWTGAEVFVVIDDYDLVATQSGSPVAGLASMLPQGHDIGLHVALARRAGGASRSLFEPMIQALRDLAQPGLLLSGSPDEGPLIGNIKPAPQESGRGFLLTRETGLHVVQTAWTEPAH